MPHDLHGASKHGIAGSRMIFSPIIMKEACRKVARDGKSIATLKNFYHFVLEKNHCLPFPTTFAFECVGIQNEKRFLT